MSENSNSRLGNFPINFLAVLLGLMGYSLALQKSEHIFDFGFPLYKPFLYFTILLFVFFLVVYAIKCLKYPEEVKNEFNHPIKINFYPILAKLFLILAIIYYPLNTGLSKYFWFVGALLQIISSVVIMYIWIRHTKFEFHHLNPAWFIPIVGNVLVPIAGSQHGFIEISWFFFSIGLVMWIALFIIVFNRIIFHNPLPDKLIPTFFILYAPPAIAFIAYVNITGALDGFARVLYYISFFLVIVVFTQVKVYSKIKFYISWWAYTFPTVAFTVATILMYHKTHIFFFNVLAIIMLLILTLIIIYVSYRTVKAVRRKEICIQEE
ncbi:SLAC1 anion channel family protein [Flexistipes sp.]|uniref:SLAC1 anion channel family protein n=1 Tax=Flexistipes sp. TaxID=3088135 RepID=UPI002E1F8044|nr:SLAC1 anion channel family protein [Flexistipes sp.]